MPSEMTATTLPPIHAIPTHDHPITRIAFGANGRLMATADTEMTVKVWRDREPIRTFDLRSTSDKVKPLDRVSGLCFSQDGDRVVVAAGEAVRGYDFTLPDPIWEYVPPRLLAFLIVAPASLAVSPRGTLAATFDNDTLAFWDRGERPIALIRHNSVPRRIAFLPDDTVLGADPFSVTRWSADRRKPLSETAIRDRIYGMAVSLDGRYLALRHLWHTTVQRLEDGVVIAQLRQGRGLPLVAFSPDSKVLAIGAQHAIHLYRTEDPSSTAKLALDDSELVSLCFLPDGSQFLAGCSDGRIRTWDNPFFHD